MIPKPVDARTMPKLPDIALNFAAVVIFSENFSEDGHYEAYVRVASNPVVQYLDPKAQEVCRKIGHQIEAALSTLKLRNLPPPKFTLDDKRRERIHSSRNDSLE